VTEENKYRLLQRVFWDYDLGKLPLGKIVTKEFSAIDKYDFHFIITRLFERLSWYELLEIVGIDGIKELLTSTVPARLRNKDLKDRYERIRKILFNEPLPVSGWDPEYRKAIRATLLSNRWYSS
jgi:hypothetical protein